LPGDEIVPNASVVMDRAFTLPDSPQTVWPWFVQLGKNRAGWYFPRSVERFMIPNKTGMRLIDSQFQNLQVGDIIPDWGGKNATFKAEIIEKDHCIVYSSKRGKTDLTWAIVFTPLENNQTRVQLRLRLGTINAKWAANTFGNFMDAVTVAGLNAGLRERLRAAVSAK